MAELRYEKFTGATAEEATAKLQAAMADGSFPVVKLPVGGYQMWMTQQEIIPGVMQAPTFVIHVTAWVDVP